LCGMPGHEAWLKSRSAVQALHNFADLSVQVPARRAAERDDGEDRCLAGGDLAGGKRTAADLGACFW
jgi:hypothetical protein